jgi:hypothetical protein
MKKNAMLKIAAILMVAVLLTTCAISSTFAKYVTDGTDVNTSARVAKWGVTVTVDGANAFATDYDDVAAATVHSTVKVVAPGTANEDAVSIVVAGQPEVDATIEVPTTTFVDLANFGSYCPIIFTVKAGASTSTAKTFYVGGTNHAASGTIADVDALETAINTFIAASFKDADYEAEGTTAIDMVLEIGWEWEFEGSTVASQTDDLDSDLGDLAADANADNDPTITFAADVTVTQKD